jgi:hypothetical protein
MNSNHNPETMTADERRAEVAGLLARGLLRAVRDARVTHIFGQRESLGIRRNMP